MFCFCVLHDVCCVLCVGNVGKKLADVSARDIDYGAYPAVGDDDSDHLSQGSGEEEEELRWRLHNLTREVDELKATLGMNHIQLSKILRYFQYVHQEEQVLSFLDKWRFRIEN